MSDSEGAQFCNWEGPNDPENPMNWATWRKVAVISVVSAMGFTTPFAADISAPAIPQILQDFCSTDQVLAGFVVSIYVLGNAVGPIFFAPSSEIWGRSRIFHLCNILFTVFTVGCALAPNMASLLIFRFLAGCAGAAPLAVGGGTIADITTVEQRGHYFAIFGTGAQIAPLVGPIIGGALTQALSWRWSFWIIVILHSCVTVAALMFLKETHAPTILKKLGRVPQKLSTRQEIFSKAAIRPLQLLFCSPIVIFLSIFQALVYGYRFLMYTTLPVVFDKLYDFGPIASGLALLGSGIGAAAALYTITKISDMITRSKSLSSEGKAAPELRIIPMIYGSPLTPVGLLWFGWSAQMGSHWIVSILGSGVFAAGAVAATLPANLYVIDAVPAYAASAIAATTFFRSIFGGLIPLAGNPMYSQLGVGWGCSLLALVAALLCAVPPFVVKYGALLRLRYPLGCDEIAESPQNPDLAGMCQAESKAELV